MGRHLPAAATRAIRLLWPDGNPLRRGLDRLEGMLIVALAVVFLAGAPLAAVVAGHVAYADGARKAELELVNWHRVRAVLLARPISTNYTGPPEAPAAWTASDGTRHTGAVPAPPGAQPGSAVRVWIDAAGRLTGPPLTPEQVRGQEILVAALAPVALGLLLVGAGLLAHCLLSRRRLADWDADWYATGPRWSRQR